MSCRVYMLLDIADGQREEICRCLQGKTGIVLADVLEGEPDVLVMLEAVNRRQLVRLTMETISVVEQVAENVTLLPVCNRTEKEVTRAALTEETAGEVP